MNTHVAFSTLSIWLTIVLNVYNCCPLSKDMTPTPVIVGTMGGVLRLPGQLQRGAYFYKDGLRVYPHEHIYQLTNGSSGMSRVLIRFLTCTDEGMYTIGEETFMLRVKSDTCGMFYYSVRAYMPMQQAALIGPLAGVCRIYMLNVDPTGEIWSLTEVWNNTMGKITNQCCFTYDNGERFVGYGGTYNHYYIYHRHGQPDMLCSSVTEPSAIQTPRPSVNVSPPGPELTDLTDLEDVNTSVHMSDVSGGG